MDFWHRGVIGYLQKTELAPKDIHIDTVATLGDDAPALSIVQKWAAEFKRGRETPGRTSCHSYHPIKHRPC